MKKITILLSVCIFIFSAQGKAQSAKQKAENAFTKSLNNTLKNTVLDEWESRNIITLDAPFTISEAGIISVTVRYSDKEGSFIRKRLEAPVSTISEIAYDLYLLLKYKTDEVKLFMSEPDSEELIAQEKDNYLHIGIPKKDGYTAQKKLQNLLKKLLKYYKPAG